MIQYSLKCAEGHEFDSWFQSASAFDRLATAGMVSCAVCGGTKVEKAVMAPRVRTARAAEARQRGPAPDNGDGGPLSRPASVAEQALAELRKKIEADADYVGREFAAEARAIHAGEAPERAIFGEAKADEAKSLIEDGVPVMPLPFIPERKTN